MKVSTKLSLVTGIAAIVMLVVGITSFASISYLIQANAWVSHSKEVLQQINMLLFDLSDTVATQRAYIISDKHEFYDAYRTQVAATEANVQDIQRLVADDPEQTARITKLAVEVRERLDSLETTLKLYKEKGSAAAFERIRTGKSLQFRIDLQRLIGEMKQYEIDLLDKRDKELKKSTYSSEMTVGIGVSLALVFFALYNYLFGHTIVSCIRQLVTASENIKYGRFDLMASTSTNDEFSDLAAAFNNLGQQLLVATNNLKDEKKSNEELSTKLTATKTELAQSQAALSGAIELRLKQEVALADHKASIEELTHSLSELAQVCRNIQGVESTSREHVHRVTLLNDTAGSQARKALSNSQSPAETSYPVAVQNLRANLGRVADVSSLGDKLVHSLEMIATTAELENARADSPNKMIEILVRNLRETCNSAKNDVKEMRAILASVESHAAAVLESNKDYSGRLTMTRDNSEAICKELDKQAELCHELRLLYEDSLMQKCSAFIRKEERLGVVLADDLAQIQQITTKMAETLSSASPDTVPIESV